jgi:PAS domain S-box-containing protein
MNATATESPDRLGWKALPWTAQLYIAAVIVAGAAAITALFPKTWPPADLFAALLLASCVTSTWKVNLPIPLSSGSTLSMSYAANLTALLLLGPPPALLVALAGTWTQCTFKVKRTYPMYRTAFSLAAEAITMAATAAAYAALGGSWTPVEFEGLARPLVGAIAAYFVVNTSLVAAAIALSTRQPFIRIWREDFLWSASGFIVGGSAGAVASVIAARGQVWSVFLMAMPVYVAYRTYAVFVGRLDDQRRHVEQTERLHAEAVAALRQARESELALAEQKEQLVVMLRSIGDGVMACNRDGTILLINKAAETLTGWPADEAIGQPLSSVFQSLEPESRRRCNNFSLAAADAADASGRRCSSILVARDLTERHIEECATPLSDGSGQTIGVMLAFRDISDALRVQEERARTGRLESLGLLAGGIAHDFNNILMAIMGNISMARATMPAGVAAGVPLAEAEHACVRARQVTWQLLTFSKGGVPLRKPVGIARLLEEAAALALRGSNVSCTFEIAPDLHNIEADDVQLVQVFTNVLINAQQAMPHGGVITVRAETVVEPARRSQLALPVEPGTYLRVTVIDRGIGIPAEHVPRIFDPYFSTKQRGSGLGLATTYSIVKNHGGFIAVDSGLGRGTTMQIHFPVATAARQVAPLIVASGSNRPRILVMDDEAAMRTLAANMLEFLGYDAEVVDGGNAALERFDRALRSERHFDAVMLDLMVPGDLGGREAVGRLARLDPAIRAVLVTGYAQDAVVTDFREYGFAAKMTKPYSLQELRSTLETVLPPAPCRVH